MAAASATTEEVKLLGLWVSPYVTRAGIALNLKKVGYEFVQVEVLGQKSEILVKSNPVYKKIPVLIHQESPSAIHRRDLDQRGSHPPLPPLDRAVARFWATYIDDKLLALVRALIFGATEGKSKAEAADGGAEAFQLLEEAFAKCSHGKEYFGGDTIGFLDIALGCWLGWIKATEEMSNFKFLDEKKVPLLVGWAERFLQDKAVKEVTPEIDEYVQYAKMISASAPTSPPEAPMDLFSSFVSLAAAVVGLLLLATRTWAALNSNRKRYPPVVGTIFHQFLNFRRLHDYHTQLSLKHKTFRLLSPLCHQIYTTDPAVVEYILKTNFDNYGKGWYNYGNMKDLFGDGIFAVDGDKWRHQRKLASFGFSTKVLREFSGAIFKRNAVKLAHVLSTYATSNEKFDMQDLLMKSTMDSIFRIGFGLELNCLDDSDNHGSEFAKAFDASNEFIMMRYVNALWKVMRFLNIGGEKTLKSKVKLVDDFIYKLIRIRVEEMSSEGSDSEGKDDILSRFLEESRKDPQNIDLKYLRDIILNFNPPVQEKIYQEVKEVIEASEDAAFDAFAESIGDEPLNKMHYLHAALSETLRLYPAVPLENKVCFSDDILPGGYNVRKGDIVFYQPYAMGRMEYLWGKDAEIFRPERWLDDGGVFQPESPYKFSAFQAGPRICLGKEFAYRQMKIFAAVLLRFFRFKLGDEKKDVEYRTTVTLHVDHGLYLQKSNLWILKHNYKQPSLTPSLPVVSEDVLAGLLLLATCTRAVLIRSSSSSSSRYPPVAGTVFHQALNFRRLHDYHTQLSRKHKTFRLLSPLCHHIYTVDPTVVEHILKGNFENYGKGWYNYTNLKDLFGDGIFVVDGDKWRHQRKLASFGFSTKAIKDFSGAVFRSNAAKLAHIIASYADSNEKFEIQVSTQVNCVCLRSELLVIRKRQQGLFMKSTMDSIFRTAFGVELNCLGGSDHAGSEFAKAFDASGEIITLRYINVFWKIMRFLNIGSEATLKKKIKVVDDFVYKLIHLRIQQISSTANDSTKNEDILSRFLEESKKDPQNMSLKYLRDIMLNLVLAGKDSTASTLSWFFYLICKNPSVQEKIYQEVMEVIEASEDAAFDVFSRNIIDESLNNMHYLHAALSETLRLYPVAPIDNKVCFSDDILPGGYIVRKGDIVFYQPYAMGRMECLWGEDAEIFRQRGGWMMMASSSLKAPTSWSENLRKEVAYRQMKTFAAVLLRFFKFKLGDEKKVVHYKTSTTLLVDEEG
ncbi:cytochrome P450 [Musa troglodytarum]|uniref:glutathione transferase n=1 Tax=Musa troglodytarum TaxID=320322 RepID=A0A9E7K685_9LILI|nr:cytochrome P450 [Musa troglodytarum]